VEDDHVDRPGVEVQQCMKLTGTNSSIGLIVLVASAHQAPLDGARNNNFSVLTRENALRTARATKRDGLWPVSVPKAPSGKRLQRRV
jgi:hypothetical protein